jgi:hypothetical protein
MVLKRWLGGRGNIARVLTKRVHFAAFGLVQSLRSIISQVNYLWGLPTFFGCRFKNSIHGSNPG